MKKYIEAIEDTDKEEKDFIQEEVEYTESKEMVKGKQITNRTYQIKNAIEFMRFSSGLG